MYVCVCVCVCVCIYIYIYIIYVNALLDIEQVKNIQKGETILEKVHTKLVTDGMVYAVVYSEEEYLGGGLMIGSYTHECCSCVS